MVGYQRFETMWNRFTASDFKDATFSVSYQVPPSWMYHLKVFACHLGFNVTFVINGDISINSWGVSLFPKNQWGPFRNNLVKPSQLPQWEEQARQRLFEEGEAKGLWGPPVGILRRRSVNRHVLKPHYFFPANQWVVVFLSHRLRGSWAFVCVFFISCCENRWSYLPMSIDMSLYNIEPRLPTSQLLF